jgi:hypothetical protein
MDETSDVALAPENAEGPNDHTPRRAARVVVRCDKSVVSQPRAALLRPELEVHSGDDGCPTSRADASKVVSARDNLGSASWPG